MKRFVDIFKSNKEDLNNCQLPFGSDDCGKFLRKTYANSINETVILDESLYECIEEYDEIVSSISKLESRKKVIEHKLQSNLKEYEIGFCKERKITWKSVTKTSVDTKKLREDLPEVVDGYLKTSTSRVFRIGSKIHALLFKNADKTNVNAEPAAPAKSATEKEGK